MKSSLKSVLSLTLICLVVTVALAAVNHVTSPIIEEAEKKAENEALRVVLPSGESFTVIDIPQGLPEGVTKIFREDSGKGYVFRMSASGYSSGLEILCGVSPEGTVTGAVCLSSKETLGVEKTYGENFTGVSLPTVGRVDTVSGATLTTGAYRVAVYNALLAFEILEGGNK